MIVLLRMAPGLPGAGSPVLVRDGERGPVRDSRGREWPLTHGLGAEIVLWLLDGPRPTPPGCLAPAGEAALTRVQRAQLVKAGCLAAEPVPVHQASTTARGRARRVSTSAAPVAPRSSVQVGLFGART